MGEKTYYIARKHPNFYLVDVVENLINGKKVILEARGTAISNAANVAEITRNRFIEAVYEEISLRTDKVEDRPITAIKIVLAPPKKE